MRATALSLRRRPTAGPSATAVRLWIVLTIALSSVAAVLGAGTDVRHPGLVAMTRGLSVAIPMAVGLGAWRRQPGERFGPLLLATGVAWFLTTLGESHSQLLYSVARISAWPIEVMTIYLVLSFPSGRLSDSRDRWIVIAGGLLVLVAYLP